MCMKPYINLLCAITDMGCNTYRLEHTNRARLHIRTSTMMFIPCYEGLPIALHIRIELALLNGLRYYIYTPTFVFCCALITKSGKSYLIFPKSRLPILTMNDYRHFSTGPYSRGAKGVYVVPQVFDVTGRQPFHGI